MARMSNREKYISHLLTVNKRISEQICTEINEVFHERGRCSADVKETLTYIIEENFEHIHYKEGDQND